MKAGANMARTIACLKSSSSGLSRSASASCLLEDICSIGCGRGGSGRGGRDQPGESSVRFQARTHTPEGAWTAPRGPAPLLAGHQGEWTQAPAAAPPPPRRNLTWRTDPQAHQHSICEPLFCAARRQPRPLPPRPHPSAGPHPTPTCRAMPAGWRTAATGLCPAC